MLSRVASLSLNYSLQSALRLTAIRAMSTVIPKVQYGFKLDNKLKKLVLHEDLPVPTPGPTDVLVKLTHVSLCHSDLHVLYDNLEIGDDFVMGHEISGEVAAIGDKVTHLDVGQKVVASGPDGCGSCAHCRTGADNDCIDSLVHGWFGLGKDGGYQQYLLVNRPQNLIKVPEGVPMEVASPITDAVLTPYHALKALNLNPASNILFVGCGGLGSSGLQIAKAFGATVTVVEKKDKARELAKALGADFVYETLPELIPVQSFDHCVDFVSVQKTFDICQKYVRSKGTVVPVGLGAAELKFNLSDLALREVRILGTFWGTSQDLVECLELVRKGLVKPQIYTIQPLKKLPEFVEKLRNNEYEGRAVFTP
ncbi:uncharacterized protein KQ657_000332 [Scheffersomyces spartinae]|uniref:Enoyl reductase (ER) domain-containing protein n=1 Tax=Scheffersomyces spartinae TaxID=45513 RepID=A0A9P8AHR5_9ASCO|nr:uncharacterized protein KQ657_000332 [Scheffersomyces spartinae]KAG7193647.1 hypothetical protein KQ657_000332 [Scheffersomyces spartinae]